MKRCRCGGARGGYIQLIREVGINATAGTTGDGACLTKMHGKSSGGRPYSGTCVNFRTTASRAISRAASASAKRCSTGLSTVAGFSRASQKGSDQRAALQARYFLEASSRRASPPYGAPNRFYCVKSIILFCPADHPAAESHHVR